MRLYLDDTRETPYDFDLRAFTAKQAIRMLQGGAIDFISFDHDLGAEVNGTGYDVAKWLEEQAASGLYPPIGWAVHSGNPVGRQNIEAAMRSAERFWNQKE